MSNFALPMALPNFPAAIRDAGSSFAPARLAACVSFSLVDDSDIPQAVQLLSAMLADSELQIRIQSIESLAALVERGADVDRASMQCVYENGHADLRAVLLQNGRQLLSSPLIAAIDAASSKDELLRYSAAVSLGAMLDDEKAQEIRNVLLTLLDDESMEVRITAAFQLGARGSEKSAVLLESLVESQDDKAIEAMIILAQLGLSRSRKVLENVAQRRFAPPALRAMASTALIRMYGNSYFSGLNDMLQSWRKSRRLAALRACAAIPSDSLAETLAHHVVSAVGEDEQSAALWALWQVVSKYPHCAPVLNELRVHLGKSLTDELSEYGKG
ncbi:MAG: HEAT repeat domain-containing protein [Deltaproteobacteria bacterium]|nr:HEAT repeat domain-containing protein [Deltaproteobacteria bacterium]